MNVGRQVDLCVLLCHSRGGGADEVGTLSIFFDGHSHGTRRWEMGCSLGLHIHLLDVSQEHRSHRTTHINAESLPSLLISFIVLQSS